MTLYHHVSYPTISSKLHCDIMQCSFTLKCNFHYNFHYMMFCSETQTLSEQLPDIVWEPIILFSFFHHHFLCNCKAPYSKYLFNMHIQAYISGPLFAIHTIFLLSRPITKSTTIYQLIILWLLSWLPNQTLINQLPIKWLKLTILNWLHSHLLKLNID